MSFVYELPSQRLISYVRCYWQVDYTLPSNTILTVPFGCTGYTHFVFCLLHPYQISNKSGIPMPTAESTVFGQITQPTTKYLQGSTLGIIVDFTPLGMQRLWGFPVQELTNQSFNLAEIIPHLHQLTDQLREASSANERFTLMDAYLVRRLTYVKPTDGRIEAAISLLQQNQKRRSIKQIAEKVNCSERTLNRRFTEQVGISPISYSRMQRFLKTLRWLQQYSQPNWNDLLMATTYYDQAHMINEFKHFAGKSPLDYGASSASLHDFLRQT